MSKQSETKPSESTKRFPSTAKATLTMSPSATSASKPPRDGDPSPVRGWRVLPRRNFPNVQAKPLVAPLEAVSCCPALVPWEEIPPKTPQNPPGG